MIAVLAAVAQVLAALSGLAGLGALLKYSSDKRSARSRAGRDDATAAKEITETAVRLLGPLREQVDELSADLAQSRVEAVALRDDVRGLHEWVQLLIEVITNAGLDVPPRPTPVQLPPAPPRRRPRRATPS